MDIFIAASSLRVLFWIGQKRCSNATENFLVQMREADVKSISMLFVILLVLTACASGGGNGPPAEGGIQLERNSEFDGESLRFS